MTSYKDEIEKEFRDVLAKRLDGVSEIQLQAHEGHITFTFDPDAHVLSHDEALHHINRMIGEFAKCNYGVRTTAAVDASFGIPGGATAFGKYDPTENGDLGMFIAEQADGAYLNFREDGQVKLQVTVPDTLESVTQLRALADGHATDHTSQSRDSGTDWNEIWGGR